MITALTHVYIYTTLSSFSVASMYMYLGFIFCDWISYHKAFPREHWFLKTQKYILSSGLTGHIVLNRRKPIPDTINLDNRVVIVPTTESTIFIFSKSIYLLITFMLCFIWNWLSLFIFGRSGTLSVDQVLLKFIDPTCLATWVLGLKSSSNTIGIVLILNFIPIDKCILYPSSKKLLCSRQTLL